MKCEILILLSLSIHFELIVLFGNECSILGKKLAAYKLATHLKSIFINKFILSPVTSVQMYHTNVILHEDLNLNS
jgi:hypothetical protein